MCELIDKILRARVWKAKGKKREEKKALAVFLCSVSPADVIPFLGVSDLIEKGSVMIAGI